MQKNAIVANGRPVALINIWRNIDAKLRRVVWSESDGLPGVIIDRYGNDFVLQTLTLAMDME